MTYAKCYSKCLSLDCALANINRYVETEYVSKTVCLFGKITHFLVEIENNSELHLLLINFCGNFLLLSPPQLLLLLLL